MAFYFRFHAGWGPSEKIYVSCHAFLEFDSSVERPWKRATFWRLEIHFGRGDGYRCFQIMPAAWKISCRYGACQEHIQITWSMDANFLFQLWYIFCSRHLLICTVQLYCHAGTDRHGQCDISLVCAILCFEMTNNRFLMSLVLWKVFRILRESTRTRPGFSGQVEGRTRPEWSPSRER